MVLDFDANIVITIIVCITIILCVKYGLAFIVNAKRANASKKLAELLDKCTENDFDKDKENAEKQK